MIRSLLILVLCSVTVNAAALEKWTSDASGFDTASWWYDTGREVVVFDAQFTPALAAQVVAAIHARTASPIRWLVITHPNPDKFNGAPVFQRAGARVVTSRKAAAALPGVHAYKKAYFVGAGMFTAETYPALATVDVTFEGTFALPLDGAPVTLHELGAGVSSTQVVAEVPSEHALVVGDLIHHGVHAWLEGGIVDGKPAPDLAQWKRTLAALAPFAGAIVYDGRGTPAPLADAVAAQVAYLDGARAVITGYLAELGAQGTPDYQELTRRMAAAFPAHRLPYLITYGAYGLVDALRSAAR